MRPMMPPPAGMRGPIGPRGPRGFLTDEEKNNKPKFSKALLLRILKYLKPYKWHFLLVFLALIVSAVLVALFYIVYFALILLFEIGISQSLLF